MFRKKALQAVALSLAALGMGLIGPEASAQNRGHGGYSDRHTSDHHRGDRSSHHRQDYHRNRGHSHQSSGRTFEYQRNSYNTRSYRQHHSRGHSGGYWTRVYRPPVYATRYNRCGQPYRVLVRCGYYERVWVPYNRGTCR